MGVPPIFFDQSAMNHPTDQYICWLDVMGSRSVMGRSMGMAANFVMKLHVASLEAQERHVAVQLFPMVDGVYLCTPLLSEMYSLVKEVFVSLAVTFIEEENPLYRFLVKGGISYGPVVRESDFLACSDPLLRHPDYCNRILLGIALSQAFDREKEAPPFGLVLDDSVRAFGRIRATGTVSGLFWKWWNWDKTGTEGILVKELRRELGKYYDWCSQHSASIGYKPDRIKEHKELAMQYLLEDSEW